MKDIYGMDLESLKRQHVYVNEHSDNAIRRAVGGTQALTKAVLEGKQHPSGQMSMVPFVCWEWNPLHVHCLGRRWLILYVAFVLLITTLSQLIW